MIKKVDKHMKFLKATLVVSVIFQVSSVLAIRSSVGKVTLATLAAGSVWNVCRTYENNSYSWRPCYDETKKWYEREPYKEYGEGYMHGDDRARRFRRTGAAVALGVGLTGFAIAHVHPCLPKSRYREALRMYNQVDSQIKKYPFLQGCKTSQEVTRGLESFYANALYPFGHSAAMCIAQNQQRALIDGMRIVKHAQEDFNSDFNKGGVLDCMKLDEEIYEMVKSLEKTQRLIVESGREQYSLGKFGKQ